MFAESRVSREIDDAARRFRSHSRTIKSDCGRRAPRRKMHRRHAVNGGSGDRQRIAPIQFVDGTDALGPQQTGDAERDDELGLPASRQPAQSGEIQMIVVIVAEEHNIDAGKILPPHARLAAAARTDPGERTRPLRPDRIGQDVKPLCWSSTRGVVDRA